MVFGKSDFLRWHFIECSVVDIGSGLYFFLFFSLSLSRAHACSLRSDEVDLVNEYKENKRREVAGEKRKKKRG